MMPAASPRLTETTTLLRPDAPAPASGGISGALPPDLIERVRGRVRLLALLLFLGFAFDVTVFLIEWAAAALARRALPPDFFDYVEFQWVYFVSAVASAALWWAAGHRRLSPSRLHTLGLVYEVVICGVMAVSSIWQHYLDRGAQPNLTWVPTIVVLFPLIMPGPPLRMLVAAIAAAATWPLAILALDLAGKVPADSEAYGRAIVGAALAVTFAYLGARIVYGLGRELTAARAMGSYQLEQQLGQGGMGEVWRARHRMLARPAAIKLIRPALLGDSRPGVAEELRRRFAREAEAIAELRSPHTVNLYDFGITESGDFYYAMELLDGLTADALVKRFGPLPPERAIYVLKQMCHSLSEADSRGLVHRDIKPANVFLCRYGEDFDFVKVLDFGLVKALGDPRELDSGLSRENAVQGTPAFIAPEQAMGLQNLDGRVDLYATGCVAYWLLTGQLVFDAATPMALAAAHIHTPPQAPSTRTDRPIPEALDRLVLSCLAKSPANRPSSAGALARELDAVYAGPPWTQERARDWWTSHRPAATVSRPPGGPVL